MSINTMIDVARKYPFAVATDDPRGLKVYEITRHTAGGEAVVRLRHDTARNDPTLVEDVLMERFDPEETHKMSLSVFSLFFRTLDEAVEVVKRYEEQHGWRRKHLLECKKAFQKAQRDVRMTEDAIRLSQRDDMFHLSEGKAARRRITMAEPV